MKILERTALILVIRVLFGCVIEVAIGAPREQNREIRRKNFVSPNEILRAKSALGAKGRCIVTTSTDRQPTKAMPKKRPHSWRVWNLCVVVYLLPTLFPCWFDVVAPASAANLQSAEALFRAGDYEQCLQIAGDQVYRGVWNDRWPRLLIRCQLRTGKYGAALESYEAALKRYSANISLRMLGARVLELNNDPRRAEQERKQIYRLVEASPRRYSSRESLVALGRYFLGQGEDAREVLELFFDRVLKTDSKYLAAHMATAELGLAKHDYQLATEALKEAAEIQPDDPQIAYLAARAWQDSDSKRAALELGRAINLNPRHVPSLLYQADRLIDAEQYEAAQQSLTGVLAVDVQHPLAWAYHAVIAHLQGHYEGEMALREVALHPWQSNPEVDYTIGKKLSDKYRFSEGAAYQRSALAMNPNYGPAKFQLAQDLLRLGNEEEGWRLADDVHASDGYNVVAHNLVTLHDRIKNFQTIEKENLIVRMDAREARVYGEQVVALLKQARDTLCAKYEVEPSKPIIVEIFPEQKDFAIRTFGLPGGAGFLGVCFGRVITANSPAALDRTPSNWQAVLWHEFCHVVTLEKTHNRMPRWLSEGISVYEEIQRDPSWGQSMVPQYREMILGNGDDLTPVSELSGAFLNPKSPAHLQFAYYESCLVVEYLVETYGLETLKRILVDLGVGMPINTSLARYVGSLDSFDRQFAEFARKRAASLAPELDWDRAGMPERASVNQWREWLSNHPGNYWALRKLAEVLIQGQQWNAAKEQLLLIHKHYPTDATAGGTLEMLAKVYRELGDDRAEKETLERLSQISSDSIDAYRRLAEIESAAENWPGVLRNAERLIDVNPLRPVGQEYLALAAERLDRSQTAVAALTALAEMDPIDPAGLHFRLAQSLRKIDQPDRARREVLRALEDAPRYRAAQKLLLELVQYSQPTAESPDATTP